MLHYCNVYVTILQWGELRIKYATLHFHILFLAFYVVFHHKTCVFCVFIIFISFFDEYEISATGY